MALTDKLTAIGDAIREKTGSTNKLTLDEMVTEIGSIEGGEVIEIDTHEGEDWLISGSPVKEIYENDRVTEIGAYGCSSLSAKVASFPNVTTLKKYAFKENTSLKKLKMPLLTELSMGCLENVGFTILDAPMVTIIRDDVLYGTDNVRVVDLPKLTTAGETVMSYTNCSVINLPNLETTGKGTFYYDSSALVYVCLPKLTTLENQTFSNTSALKIVDLPSVTSIASSSSSTRAPFYNCSKLEAIILRSETLVPAPNIIGNLIPKITSVPTYIYVPSALLEEYKAATNWAAATDYIRAIEDYPDICDVPIGCYYDEEATTVNLIKTQTAGYVSLTGIHAPKATTIYAKYSNNLIYVNAPLYAVARNGDFLGCSKLNYLDLPSLYCVYQDAFMDCTTLKKVEFTADKKAIIYANAFRNCSALETVILRHEGAVATITGAHEGANSALTYYVPSSLLASYQETYPDYTFATIEDHPEIEYAECV